MRRLSIVGLCGEPTPLGTVLAGTLFFVVAALAMSGDDGGGGGFVAALTLLPHFPPQDMDDRHVAGAHPGAELGALAASSARVRAAAERPLIDVGLTAFRAPCEMAGAQPAARARRCAALVILPSVSASLLRSSPEDAAQGLRHVSPPQPQRRAFGGARAADSLIGRTTRC